VSDSRTAEKGQSDRPDDEAVFEAPAVLRILWADPQNMPERLALWSLKRFGPRVAAATRALLLRHDFDLGSDQETKTKKALEFFSSRLSAATLS
jgi:hypothetical protein